ncbi:MAG: DUF5009 domain-containing protein [Bacteroidota bacterium]
MKDREISIDVLRGLAIVGMVLSGTISRNADLPAWLYHAQIAPPDFSFNSAMPGITWVDLVFPFFLFAMGMAFPFSMNLMLKKGIRQRKIVKKTIWRSLKLFVFAILLGHLSPFHYPQELGWIRYFMGLLAFAGFFMAFAKFPHWHKYENRMNLAGYAMLAGLLIVRIYGFDLTFSIHSNDIIILVLANMALFGGLLWLFTRKNWYLRLGIVVLYFALRLTHNIDDSWNKMLWDFTPLKWMAATFPGVYQSLLDIGIDMKRTIFYNPEFLKYLMIVIPGTIAGELVQAGMHEKVSFDKKPGEALFIVLPSVLLANIALNLWGLLSRNLDFVWIMNLATMVLLWYLSGFKGFKNQVHTRNLLLWSIFWLLLGLVFEAYEGGIKKDHSTISYFFLTSGLAGFSILVIKMFEPIFRPGQVLGFAALTGMNPILGYVAAAYLVMPLLFFVHILPWMDQWHTLWPWLGVLRGIILTGFMVVVTVISVKQKYFWKT